MAMTRMYRCVIMRGGTSKAVFLRKNDISEDPAARDRVILSIFGSPDVRQIDGLGGSDITTSKVAVISRSTRPDCDVDYLFGQVSLAEPRIDWTVNCGNISSAVGPYAIDEGLVPVQEGYTTVRIYQVNTAKRLIARVPVCEGKAAVDGDFRIDGVPGTAAKIELDFGDVGGAATGRVLPTGSPQDQIEFEGKTIAISLVDSANPVVFVRARDLGLAGTEARPQLSQPELLFRIEEVRSRAAHLAGFAKDWHTATAESPVRPMVSLVSPPASYRDYVSGKPIDEGDIDILSRIIYNQMVVESHTGTGAVCVGTACLIPGTLAYEAASAQARRTGIVRIGHPRGVMQLEMEIDATGAQPVLRKAVFARTARRILEGYVYVRESQSA